MLQFLGNLACQERRPPDPATQRVPLPLAPTLAEVMLLSVPLPLPVSRTGY